eukprot:856487-Amphidinium_carterae.1
MMLHGQIPAWGMPAPAPAHMHGMAARCGFPPGAQVVPAFGPDVTPYVARPMPQGPPVLPHGAIAPAAQRATPRNRDLAAPSGQTP